MVLVYRIFFYLTRDDFDLQTLIGKETTCPVTGPHWDKIGFQGLDPRTDLNRSMKMFSVLQMLHFLESEPTLARGLHKLSQPSGTGKGTRRKRTPKRM